jgi:hypothetical protein
MAVANRAAAAGIATRVHLSRIQQRGVRANNRSSARAIASGASLDIQRLSLGTEATVRGS